MVLYSYNETYQTLDSHYYGKFFFHYHYTSVNVYLRHLQFEMTHNISDMDNIYF